MSTEQPWRTAIGHPEDERIVVRGYDLSQMIGKVSFAAMVHLELTGELPGEGAERMMDALFASFVEHGISPSSTVARFLSASGNPIQTAIAGGLLTFGDIHGGAGEQFAKMMQDTVAQAAASDESLADAADRLVAEARERRQPLPGYGHPQHSKGDPRTPALLAVADETGVSGAHITLAREVERALEERVGRRLPLNIDGVMGAIISDLGFDWRLARAFVMTPRAMGLAAHALEELDREGGWRHIPMDQVTYDGEVDRHLP